MKKILPNLARALWMIWPGLCVALLGGPLRAGEYSVTEWGVDDGLPQSSVTDIAQTPDGYLWIGTLISGIARFDGVQFVNFDAANTPGLAVPGVRRLLVDSQGNLWVNSGAGKLLLWRGNAFVKVADDLKISSLAGSRPGHIAFATVEGDLLLGQLEDDGQWHWQRHKPPALPGNLYYYQDAEGAFWFLVAEGKIGCFRNDHFEIFNSLPGLAGGKIQALASDAAGRIWMGTDVELACWEHGTFTNFNPNGPASKISVRRIVPVMEGMLWLEGDNRLFLYEHGRWSQPAPEWDGRRPPWSHFRTMHSDHAGGLWVSLADEGLVHVGRDGRVVRVTSADGLPSQLVQTSYADHEGNLWAGYHRGGLIAVRKQTFHAVTRREGLQDTLVTSVTEATNGAIWLGAAGGSVARWADGVCTNFTLPLRGKFCQDVVVAAGPDGRVWMGTGGNGLLVWENGGFRHAILPEQMPQDTQQMPQSVRQLLVATNGDVWFANFSGLYRFDGKNLERMVATEFTERVVASLVQGADGAIWFGTFGGVLRRWSEGKLVSYQPLDGAAPARFWALYPEADGTIWIGTMNGGLLRFRAGKFTRFTMADGLADDSVSHILADGQENLWLGSRAGVMCVAQKSLTARQVKSEPVMCRLFGRSDGLPTVAMTLEFQPSCVRARDGALWFGSPKGASWVNPDNVRPIELPPPVLVASVRADSSPLELAPPSLPAALPKITVESGVNNLEVEFTAPVFTAPDLLQFKYRLDPLDKAWISVGGRQNVTFSHLPAGEYTFRVTARNSDSLWNQRPAAFRLVVQPHFWERKSFLAAAAAAVLGSVVLLVRRITQRRLRRKLETLRQQQQIERERARIAQDLHDDLGAGLTEISLTTDLALNPALPEYESRQYTREVGALSRDLVQRMDEIVWAVNPRNDSVISLSVYACQYAQQLLKPLGIACRLDVQPGLPEMPLNAEQRYNFFLAFKETITNIARHSGAGELHLAIHAEGGRLVFLIADNGRGFEPGNEQAGADGLRNIRERLARMGGECTITSQPGCGTQVALRVPLTS